jgi:AAA15 family ATPase/GTPase
MKVDFSYAESKAPDNYKDLQKIPFLEVSPTNKKDRFVPVMAIYGPNASGKTNIIKAFLEYLKIIETTEIEQSYLPNKLSDKHNTTIFEIEFFFEGTKFRHSIEYDGKEIKKESLLKDDKIIYSIDNTSKIYEFSAITNDQYNDEKIKSILSVECSKKTDNDNDRSYLNALLNITLSPFKQPKQDVNSDILGLQKRVFMSVIAKQYPGLSEDITLCFIMLLLSVRAFESNSITKEMIQDIQNDWNIRDATKALKKLKMIQDIQNDWNIDDGNKEYIYKYSLIDRASRIIRKFDIDILKIEVSLKPLERAFPHDLMRSYHKNIQGQEVIFDMETEESGGTNILFGLVILLICTLDAGGTVVIDEMDKSIHPFVLAKIIELFKDRDYNTGNAQLIFTTHCTDILEEDILGLSEVAIVNKNIKEGSTIKRISDFKDSPELKDTSDFRKLYLQGAFSGIPFPYI